MRAQDLNIANNTDPTIMRLINKLKTSKTKAKSAFNGLRHTNKGGKQS